MGELDLNGNLMVKREDGAHEDEQRRGSMRLASFSLLMVK